MQCWLPNKYNFSIQIWSLGERSPTVLFAFSTNACVCKSRHSLIFATCCTSHNTVILTEAIKSAVWLSYSKASGVLRLLMAISHTTGRQAKGKDQTQRYSFNSINSDNWTIQFGKISCFLRSSPNPWRKLLEGDNTVHWIIVSSFLPVFNTSLHSSVHLQRGFQGHS